MSLYTISDLHLSFGVNKPMDIFQGWENYENKLKENWESVVNHDDTVVIPGDISWGMTLKDCIPDFKFINELPGEKIISKGNHDYWFSTKTNAERFFSEHGFNTVKILHNNAYIYDNYTICGTRGWVNCNTADDNPSHDAKIARREAQRLELSLIAGQKLSLGAEPIVFLHYPPVFEKNKSEEIVNILKKYQVREVFYGHLHNAENTNIVEGELESIKYRCISCDYVDFFPIKVK